ncbi:MAG: DUF2480 family protein [Rhodothermales bacterium]
MEPIVNRVAESEIEVFDLASLWNEGKVVEFDLAPFLFHGMILKEKDFRLAMKEQDWPAYAGAHVAVFCSADAIVPIWAYMLVASKLKNHAASVGFGTPSEVIRDFFVRALDDKDWSPFQDRIVVIKGCGNQIVPMDAYMIATQKLQDVAKKLMYGEPCSSVPLWRRPKAAV